MGHIKKRKCPHFTPGLNKLAVPNYNHTSIIKEKKVHKKSLFW